MKEFVKHNKIIDEVTEGIGVRMIKSDNWKDKTECEPHELFCTEEYWMSGGVEVIMQCGKCKQKFKGILFNYDLSNPSSSDQEEPGVRAGGDDSGNVLGSSTPLNSEIDERREK